MFLKRRKGNIKTNLVIDRAARTKEKLAALYDVPISSIIWMGDDRYIIVKNGKEFCVEMFSD